MKIEWNYFNLIYFLYEELYQFIVYFIKNFIKLPYFKTLALYLELT